MGKTLFPYQERAYNDCMSFLLSTEKGDDSGICIAPTAHGKSLLLAKMSQEVDFPILFVVPSIELLKQNKAAIEGEGGIVSVYSGSFGKKVISGLTIATVGSLKDVSKFKENKNKHVVVDEADYKYSEIGMFNDFIKDLKPKKLLGLTATPFKTASTKGFVCPIFLDKLRPKLFKKIIHVTQVQEVIDAGRWSKLEYVSTPFDDSRLKVNSSGTEFDDESVRKELELQGTRRSLCKDLREILKTKKRHEKVLVFMDSVETANIVSDWVNGLGLCKAAVISAGTKSSERNDFIEEYKVMSSDAGVIINYATLTTGFDCSLISHILIGRPFGTIRLFYQVVGRGVRVNEIKPFCTIHDYCGNIERWGKVEDLNYENIPGFGWGLFSGERLLTGVPLRLDKVITKEWLKNPPKPVFVKSDLLMPFGKFVGLKVKFLKKFYRDFLLDKMDLDITVERNRDLKDLLEQLREQEYLKLFQ